MDPENSLVQVNAILISILFLVSQVVDESIAKTGLPVYILGYVGPFYIASLISGVMILFNKSQNRLLKTLRKVEYYTFLLGTTLFGVTMILLQFAYKFDIQTSILGVIIAFIVVILLVYTPQKISRTSKKKIISID